MRRGTRIHQSSRTSSLDLSPDVVWAVVADGSEGEHWYADALPLQVRGAVDRLVGGGGRRWPAPGRPLLETGDRVGFWRVTRAAGQRLDLTADVRSPGRVLLRTRVAAAGAGSTLTQDVSFDPDGLLGQLYMVVDLPAREAVIELVHRRLLAEIGVATGSSAV